MGSFIIRKQSRLDGHLRLDGGGGVGAGAGRGGRDTKVRSGLCGAFQSDCF